MHLKIAYIHKLYGVYISPFPLKIHYACEVSELQQFLSCILLNLFFRNLKQATYNYESHLYKASATF